MRCTGRVRRHNTCGARAAAPAPPATVLLFHGPREEHAGLVPGEQAAAILVEGEGGEGAGGAGAGPQRAAVAEVEGVLCRGGGGLGNTQRVIPPAEKKQQLLRRKNLDKQGVPRGFRNPIGLCHSVLYLNVKCT